MKELLTQILETARHLTERLGRLHERLDALKYLVRDLNGGSAPDDRLVDVHEVAGRLDCSRKIYRATSPQSGREFPIPFMEVNGRVKFHLSDVLNHVASPKGNL